MLFPTMTSTRTLISLNGLWDFQVDKGTGFFEGWNETGLSKARPMPVPASYNDIYEGTELRDHAG